MQANPHLLQRREKGLKPPHLEEEGVWIMLGERNGEGVDRSLKRGKCRFA